MSRKPNSDQRRAEIVDALMATMAEHGYEKASIQLIARQAGLTPGLLHYHFSTKAEILLALVQHLADLSRQRFDALAAGAATPADKLAAYVHARLGLGPGADRNAVAAWVVIGAEAVRQPDVREIYGAAALAERKLAEELIAGVMRARGRSAARAGVLAASLLALMEGAFQLASAAPHVLPSGFAAPAAIDLIDRFMEGEPEAPRTPTHRRSSKGRT